MYSREGCGTPGILGIGVRNVLNCPLQQLLALFIHNVRFDVIFVLSVHSEAECLATESSSCR